MPGSPGRSRRIERGLAELGRSLSDVRRVVFTHGHPDHAGGVRELEAAGVEIRMHPADFDGLQVGVREAVRRPTRGRDLRLHDAHPRGSTRSRTATSCPSSAACEVIHTPGHTPGSICLYGRRDRLLFVGDVLQLRRGRVVFASRLYSDDYADREGERATMAAPRRGDHRLQPLPALDGRGERGPRGARPQGRPAEPGTPTEVAAMETLVELVEEVGARFDRRPALLIRPSFRTRTWRYRDLARRPCPASARVLADEGFSPGDRVIIWSVNRPEWGIAFLG